MNLDDIRVFEPLPASKAKEKPPPLANSDVWRCHIERQIDIYFHARAKRKILEHALKNRNREVGGVLIGELYRYPDKYRSRGSGGSRAIYVEIFDAKEGEFTIGSSTSLTFTPDTWSALIADAERNHPNLRIVGWYHTHPGHGVFLSGADKFIQNHFFGEGGQLALVVDHIRGRAGFFLGRESESTKILASPKFTWDRQLYGNYAASPAASRRNITETLSPDNVTQHPLSAKDYAVLRISSEEINTQPEASQPSSQYPRVSPSFPSSLQSWVANLGSRRRLALLTSAFVLLATLITTFSIFYFFIKYNGPHFKLVILSLLVVLAIILYGALLFLSRNARD